MIHVIIGQSGSGKTTFVKNKFLTEEIIPVVDVIPCSVSGIFTALGKYDIGVRTEGTDTLAYSAAAKIKEQIKRLTGKEVVMEGDRINTRSIFKFLESQREPVKLYLLVCSVQTSLNRLRKEGSGITVGFIKTTRSKSRRMFLEYGKRFDGEIISTEGEY